MQYPLDAASLEDVASVFCIRNFPVALAFVVVGGVAFKDS